MATPPTKSKPPATTKSAPAAPVPTQASEHFAVAEFTCHDGTAYPAEWVSSRLIPLCAQLETIRTALGGNPIRILSGYRTESYNAKIGGALFSQHKEGRAADIQIDGMRADIVHQAILDLYHQGTIEIGGLGLYSTFVHVDTREETAGHLAQWTGWRPAPELPGAAGSSGGAG